MGFFRRKKQIEAVVPEVSAEPEPEAVAEDKNELIAAVSAAVYLYLDSEKLKRVVIPSGPPAPFFLRPRKA